MKPQIARKDFVPGTSRGVRSRHTLALQMARAMAAQQRLEMGGRIRELRGIRTQQPIADYVGVTLRAYQAWEAGGGIAWENLEKLAAYFNVSTNYLLYGREEPQPTVQGDQLERIEAKLDQLLEAMRDEPAVPELRPALKPSKQSRRPARQAPPRQRTA